MVDAIVVCTVSHTFSQSIAKMKKTTQPIAQNRSCWLATTHQPESNSYGRKCTQTHSSQICKPKFKQTIPFSKLWARVNSEPGCENQSCLMGIDVHLRTGSCQTVVFILLPNLVQYCFASDLKKVIVDELAKNNVSINVALYRCPCKNHLIRNSLPSISCKSIRTVVPTNRPSFDCFRICVFTLVRTYFDASLEQTTSWGRL